MRNPHHQTDPRTKNCVKTERCINMHGKNERSQSFVMRHDNLCLRPLFCPILLSSDLRHLSRH